MGEILRKKIIVLFFKKILPYLLNNSFSIASVYLIFMRHTSYNIHP